MTTRDKMKNLREVQEALHCEYGNKYPWSTSVRSGLEQLVNIRYAGSWDNFVIKFVTPTLQLLKTLKQKGFPLVCDGRVIVHLAAPVQRLESGEMFFQIGHTSAGTLALKFTKYKGSDVVLQPSTVEKADYHVAFTLAYIEGLRSKARLGDQLMRIFLVSLPTEEGLLEIQKVEAKRIMSHNETRSACENTEAAEFISCGVCEDFKSITRQDAIDDSTCKKENPPYPTAELAVKDSSVTEEDSQENVLAAIGALAINPSIQSTSTKMVENPNYPPIQSAVDETLYGNQERKVISNPTDQNSSTWPTYAESRHSGAQSSSDKCENPAYPTANDAVCDNSSTATANPPYPSVYDAVKNTDQDNQQKNAFSKDCKSCLSSKPHEEVKGNATCLVENPGYPLTQFAVKDEQHEEQRESPDTAVSKMAHPAEGSFDNPSYPLPHEAVQATASASVKNPAYPSVQSAVRNSEKDVQREEVTSKRSENPSYPTASDAVQNIESVPVKNPPYPSVQCAVKNSEKDAQVEDVASKRSDNPSYPTIPEAVQNAVVTSKPNLQGTSAGSGSFENPPYPTVSEALHESRDVENSRQATIEQREGGGIPNPSCPTVQDTCEKKGIDTSGETKNAASTVDKSYPAEFDAILDLY